MKDFISSIDSFDEMTTELLLRQEFEICAGCYSIGNTTNMRDPIPGFVNKESRRFNDLAANFVADVMDKGLTSEGNCTLEYLMSVDNFTFIAITEGAKQHALNKAAYLKKLKQEAEEEKRNSGKSGK